MKLNVMLTAVLVSVLGFACAKKDDKKKGSEQPKEQVDNPADNSGKNNDPKNIVSTDDSRKVPGILGSWKNRLPHTDSIFAWKFEQNRVSHTVTCFDNQGKEFSATAVSSASINDKTVVINDNASKTAKSEDETISCAANIIAGEYGYTINQDGSMTLDYKVVVWDFDRI